MRSKTAPSRGAAARSSLTVHSRSRLHCALLAHVHAAIEALASGPPVQDESVHASRKEIKRARAVLRLLRERLGATRYRHENIALRRAAKPLTGTRDAKVMLDTLRQVLDVARRHRSHHLLDARTILENAVAHDPAAARGRDASIRTSLHVLRLARRRIGRWQLAPDEWHEIGPAFVRIYRRGRRAFKTAAADPSTENLHEWRKHVKYLWHALQLIEPRPHAARSMASRAHGISDLLGDDHDLALLAARLSACAIATAKPIAPELLPLIDARRSKLQRRALKSGTALFAERPRAVKARFGKRFCSTSVTSGG